MKYCDAHCHVGTLAEGQGDWAASREKGLGGIISCATRPEDWAPTLALAQRDTSIHAALGIHPWFADAFREADLVPLNALLKQSPAAQIGETGLDASAGYQHTFERQCKLLQVHLELAQAFKRCISLHCVHAWGALINSLQSLSPEFPFILHACNASTEVIRELCDLGGYISVGPGILDEKRGKRHRAAAKVAPLDRLLIESDCLGGGDQVEKLKQTFKAVARLRGIALRRLADVVNHNFTAVHC